MDFQEIKFLKELLYNTEKDDLISKLNNLDSPLILHYFAANYNWNSGFDVPEIILENENCDLGTGLLMFHYADGLRLIENPEDITKSTSKEWKDFLYKLYNKLLHTEFMSQSISFNPELTNIQIFKLKKGKPNIPEIFIRNSPGRIVDIPKL
ncbi:DUF4274 domain-containing protein [Metabacillus arenae]|uniref:DUF4274 domain-containing protein n=1 Tax=Metabacillus arenae TaxID=2771434 RepID=A0A926NMG1_9BACI|nr:DUF4274 domain-containing protein [Metabacillus arenae]MBD1382628.1 DUF4274 domain-containing protein [Metabacillus arenae]